MQATRKEFIIALDEGTTNAKAVVLDSRGQVVVKFSQPLAIQTPREGWVEQSGEVLVDASQHTIQIKSYQVLNKKECRHQLLVRPWHELLDRPKVISS